MSAELIDPFAPTHEPLLTPDEYEAIKADFYEHIWADPTRLAECFTITLETLRDIGCGVGTAPAVAATQALRRIVQRAVSGVPFREPSEPAWSLDPEGHRLPRYMETLDEDERRGY